MSMCDNFDSKYNNMEDELKSQSGYLKWFKAHTMQHYMVTQQDGKRKKKS